MVFSVSIEILLVYSEVEIVSLDCLDFLLSDLDCSPSTSLRRASPAVFPIKDSFSMSAFSLSCLVLVRTSLNSSICIVP